MTRSDLNFTLFLLGLSAIYVLLLLLPGALVIASYEGDTIHALDIAYRIQAGDAPGRDFVTPLGVLAFLPIAAFLELGFGPGKSFLFGQIMVLMILLPAILWVCLARLPGWVRYGFAIYLVALICALVYGGFNSTNSIFMYYNRWCWALSFLIVTLCMLPARTGFDRPRLDGVLIGAMMGALVGIKVTFFLGLGPFVLATLVHDRRIETLSMAALAGSVSLAVITMLAGYPGYFFDYAANLLTVANSEIRPHPGLELYKLLTTPALLPGTLLLFASIVFWRQVGARREGLLAAILGIGTVYISYQNWGNDPKWALMFAMFSYLIAVPGAGTDDFRRLAPRFLAFGFLVFALPSAANIFKSPFRAVTAEQSGGLLPMFPQPARQDVLVLSDLRGQASGIVPLHEAEEAGAVAPDAGNEAAPVRFRGTVFASCKLYLGAVEELWRMVGELGAIPELRGARVLLADFSDYLWLFGDFERVKNTQPWYYGGDVSGLGAEYVAVPACPVDEEARREKLRSLDQSALLITEIAKTSSVTVYRLE